jgi:hypothetical protein
MSKLSDSIQRQRYMDNKGHNIMTVEKRCVVSDRSKPIVRRKPMIEGQLQEELNTKAYKLLTK